MSDKEFAKQVAKQLDRRRFRRRLLIAAALVTAVVIAALYLTCGDGFGLGGKGKGSGAGSGPGSAAPALHRCALRVSAAGLTLDGKPATVAAAVAGCKDGADVTVTGDAREGDWDALRQALTAAKIPYYKKT